MNKSDFIKKAFRPKSNTRIELNVSDMLPSEMIENIGTLSVLLRTMKAAMEAEAYIEENGFYKFRFIVDDEEIKSPTPNISLQSEAWDESDDYTFLGLQLFPSYEKKYGEGRIEIKVPKVFCDFLLTKKTFHEYFVEGNAERDLG